MGEFNLNDRKRNWDRSGRRDNVTVNQRKANPCTKSASNFDFEHAWSLQQNDFDSNYRTASSLIDSSPSQQTDDVKDVNFWTNVFFNNGPAVSGSSDLATTLYPLTDMGNAASTNTSGAPSDRRSRKPPKPTTASPSTCLLNDIISNLKDHRSKVVVNAGNNSNNSSMGAERSNDVTETGGRYRISTSSADSLLSSTPSYAFLNATKQKNALPKRKSVNGSGSPAHQGESDGFVYKSDRGSVVEDALKRRYSNNDDNLDNNDFLQVGCFLCVYIKIYF